MVARATEVFDFRIAQRKRIAVVGHGARSGHMNLAIEIIIFIILFNMMVTKISGVASVDNWWGRGGGDYS